MKRSAIVVGAKCTFVPCWNADYGMSNPKTVKRLSVTGTITYVNHAHRYFRVEFCAGTQNLMLSECFKF